MNIYKLISPVNKYNYVNHPYIKRDLDYYSQHYSDTNNTDEFSFMKRKKLSTNIYGMAYNDDYIIPKINVISNAMKVDIQDRTPLSKRVPELMQNPYIPFGDPNTKYDELISASQQMLSSVEPINYFGCRVVGDYLYNFDTGMIFKIIPKDFLARIIDPTLIKESTVYVDPRSAMIMPNKSAFKNIWMDTKRYIPIHPRYVETIDINSSVNAQQQPLGVNLNERPPDNYYTTPLPVREPVRQPIVEPVRQVEPVIAEQPVRQVVEPIEQPSVIRERTPYENYLSAREYDEQKYQQRQQDELNRRAMFDVLKDQNVERSEMNKPTKKINRKTNKKKQQQSE